jgi:hypothetical protein
VDFFGLGDELVVAGQREDGDLRGCDVRVEPEDDTDVFFAAFRAD